MKVNSKVKTAVRRLTRSAGYDLVPLAAGISSLQRRLLTEYAAVAVDVGANVGQYAERLRALGFEGQIVSFEPGADAFAALSVKALRSKGTWDARNVALSDVSGGATLRVSGNSVSSSLLDVAEEHLAAAPSSATVSTEQVKVSTLDEQLIDLDGPLRLKLDVQGLELSVLRGGPRTLQQTVAVQAEISFTHLYDGQTKWLDLCAFLQDNGFLLRYLEPGYEDRRTGFMLQADVVFVRAT